MRPVLAFMLTLLLAAPAGAFAAERPGHPCLRSPKGGPSEEMLATLGVLRRPATEADRPPRWIRQNTRRAWSHAIRFAPLPAGGGIWIVPIEDTSDRVVPSEACIRTLPRRLRRSVRRQKRRDLRRPPVEGLEIYPIGADGESRGGAGSPGADGIRRLGMVHSDGTRRDRATLVVGLVPDGVAQVRVELPAFRDERGRQQPARTATVPVSDNVYAAELPSPFDFESPEPVITWLDAAGAVIGPEAERG